MMKKLVGKITFVKVMIVASVVLFGGAVYGWWHWVYSSPKSVFNRMLATSLSTTSVTRAVKQDDGVQILEQTSQLSIGGEKRVHATNRLRQVTDAGTVVDTESVATPTTDYVRYTDIQTSQKTPNGGAYDFSSVLGIWGRASNKDVVSGGAQLFNQNIFGVVPLANLPAGQRKDLVKLIKDKQVFQTDFSKTAKYIIDGRPVYSYEISMKPSAYVTMLKHFAADLGMRQLESLDPEQYADSDPLQFTFDIDVWSGQLKTINYVGSERIERFSAYGAQLKTDIPTDSITLQTLQSRLQQIQ